ncbi:class I SAM-dependent methyltransferase [Natronorubrum thiooxidans]|uniref:Demethylmenaquinone methyltransferase / 2-methoxy-6-polyprenyl-1,4-benzoquinol methylase n=1 Tax=Natronorubrum thiooxidans TaxID=308853 RepID=A0A1N7GPG7_9EURY|nr:class I SAM-dependent methyltransferase [Natronorubrum thiooxidans]SIS14485.1 demethylmenaquinone methyltransferase / 2-methoxy-6-polyprenyl-1,4-benzoquinol methylase [Natronorubrum thiooxidans]
MGALQDTEATRRWFNLLAPGYDAVVPSLFWPASLQQAAIDRLELASADRVLDIGCGTGETIAQLNTDASTVHGLDLSRPQLETAVNKTHLEDARFVRGDACALPYADETFDCVVSIGSILYWSDPVEALREAHRVTKPGGELLLLGFNRRSPSWWNPIQNAQDGIAEALFFRYDREEGTTLVRSAGWTDPTHEVTGPVWGPDLVLATTARKAESGAH